MKTTITKTKDREVLVVTSPEEEKVEVCVRWAYTRPGYAKRTWDGASVIVTRAELRHIVNTLESGKSMFDLCPHCGVPAKQCDCMP